MNTEMPNRLEGIKHQLNDPLYKNTFFILSTRVVTVIVGFFFWMVAARLFSVEDVGLAVALISSATIINLFSTLGFEYSMMRFFTSYDLNKMVNTSIIIITFSSVIVGILYVISIILFPSNEIAILKSPVYVLIFLGFGLVSSLGLISGYVFIAMRKAEYYLVQNIFQSTRILFLIPLVFLGSFGILSSTLIAYVVALIFVLYALGKLIKFEFRVDRDYLSKSFKFSSGNYVANLFSEVPFQLLPLLVLSVLGSAASAQYYVAYTIGSFLSQVTYTLSTTLFVEGSHGESMKKNVVKSVGIIYALLIPGFLLIHFSGGYLLSIYGPEYVGVGPVLSMIALSCLILPVYAIFITIEKVRMGVKRVVKLNALFFALFLVIPYLLMLNFGMIGLGYSFVVIALILDAVVLAIAKWEGWF